MTSRLTSRNGRRLSLNLPAGSGLEEIEEARRELETLARQRAEAVADRAELLKSRLSAAASDLERAANAVRDGKAMPKTRQVEAVDDAIAKLDARIDAIEAAIDQVEDELVSTVEERRAERLEELSARVEEEKSRWLEVIDQAEAQLEQIATAAALVRFFTEFPTQPVFRIRGTGQLDIRGTGGDPIAPAAALDALRHAFDLREAPGRPFSLPRPDQPSPLKSPWRAA